MAAPATRHPTTCTKQNSEILRSYKGRWDGDEEGGVGDGDVEVAGEDEEVSWPLKRLKLGLVGLVD